MKRVLSATLVVAFCWVSLIPGMGAKADDHPCDSDPAGQPCLDEIAANPEPPLESIAVDKRDVDGYSFWRVLPNTDVFSEPNGAIIGRYPDGFNFVVVIAKQSGFAELRDKHWVRISQLKQTFASYFSGVMLKDMPYPVAWVIQTSIPSTEAGKPNSILTPPIKRYTRVYIYTTVHIGQWDWYLVGPNLWLEQRKVARIMPATRPDEAIDKWVSINLFEQVLTAYEGDTPVFATLISSGLPDFQTNVGTFQVWNRVPTTPMSGAMGQPDAYSLPAVPYAMFFDGDISLHGTYWHDGFGFKHSHGCVNMTITDAHWLYDWMGDGDLTVSVVSGRDTNN